ncbi:MAG TPA: sulfotransferase [Acidimicrobiales bacterium]|nr:sulfotransferase [Acidimicrobiales bacterium]
MKVVYVAGSMRSGTTLMAGLLGSYAGALTVGEINNLWFVAPTGQKCSCGEASDECDVWGPVLAHFEGGRTPVEYHKLRKQVERQRRLRELVSLRHRRESEWPTDVSEYVAMLRDVVASIEKTTGASTIVDSSKTAPGLALMRLAVGDQISVLHLLRDPRGVAYSEHRHVHATDELTSRPPLVRPLFRSAMDWDTGNLECWLVGRVCAVYHRVWYEDLCSDPRGVLNSVGEALGLGSYPLGGTGDELVLSAGHVLSGNPSRVGPQSRRITADDAWRQGLSPPEALAVALLTWPVKRALGR